MKTNSSEKLEHAIPGSFRDPSGFVFRSEDGLIRRQINLSYKTQYDKLIASGLYEKLVDESLLIAHKDEGNAQNKEGVYKIILPQQIETISYPYEWSFSQLKDAALTTLKVQSVALSYGMTIKDSSAFNIQFIDGNPIFIDTLSFELYEPGKPWQAYKQFCEHFLAPLLLMKHCHSQLNKLFRIYIDGVPLKMASTLLPKKTNFSFSVLSHIHLHAKSQNYYADKKKKSTDAKINKFNLSAMVDHLKSAVERIKWKPGGTEWLDYYEANNNYSDRTRDIKKDLVASYLDIAKPKMVWDLGGNTGFFSRIASNKGIQTVCFDIDEGCVEANYLLSKKDKESNLLPLVMDLTNPSAAIGWGHEERMSLKDRGPADTVMALALIHHLAITNNLPFDNIAKFFHQICHYLIIEFVPKEDSQVKILLASREDIFPKYTRTSFEEAFSGYFDIEQRADIEGSERTFYLMKGISK